MTRVFRCNSKTATFPLHVPCTAFSVQWTIGVLSLYFIHDENSSVCLAQHLFILLNFSKMVLALESQKFKGTDQFIFSIETEQSLCVDI